jgi:hypothetical protein
MKLEIILILAIGFVIYDTYYGKGYLKYIYTLKKHAKTVAILVGIFGVYLMIKKDPSSFKKVLYNANRFVTNIPMNHSEFPTMDTTTPISILKRMNSSGKGATKRSVSETKKKYVASSQDWKCGGCGKKLNAWFEVDHKVRLVYGGGNEVDNLVALCRECHGEKTAMENM